MSVQRAEPTLSATKLAYDGYIKRSEELATLFDSSSIGKPRKADSPLKLPKHFLHG